MAEAALKPSLLRVSPLSLRRVRADLWALAQLQPDRDERHTYLLTDLLAQLQPDGDDLQV